MLHVSMIGCGAIGIGVMELLKSDPEVTFDLIIVPEAHMESARTAVSALAPQARVVDRLNAQDRHPDLLVECAGHHAIEEHIIPALQRGIPCMVVSIGALSEPGPGGTAGSSSARRQDPSAIAVRCHRRH